MVKAGTLQVAWHDGRPVNSIDFHRFGCLATGGGDNCIRLWKVQQTADGIPAVKLMGELHQHASPVNCVRFSPNGEKLASAGDKGELLIWKATAKDNHDDSRKSKLWKPSAVLRGHLDDIFDIAWSSDSTALASASVEHIMIVWDVDQAKVKARLDGHKHYIQGVAWDPANQFLVSQSGDRTCRVYGRPPLLKQTKASAAKTAGHWMQERLLYKRPSAGMNNEDGQACNTFLFHDDTLPSLFRRLAWSPEGSFLVLPAGVHNESSRTMHTAYIYGRGKWSMPAGQLLGLQEPFSAIRFCPIFFKRNEGSKQSQDRAFPCGFAQPYKLVFAAAAEHSVAIYSTEEAEPVCVLDSIHHAEITDLAWSPDGQYLAVSSRDGNCSIAAFEDGELGTPNPQENMPPVENWCTGPVQSQLTVSKKRGVKRSADQGADSHSVDRQSGANATHPRFKTRLGKPTSSQEGQKAHCDLPVHKKAVESAELISAATAQGEGSHKLNGQGWDPMAGDTGQHEGFIMGGSALQLCGAVHADFEVSTSRTELLSAAGQGIQVTAPVRNSHKPEGARGGVMPAVMCVGKVQREKCLVSGLNYEQIDTIGAQDASSEPKVGELKNATSPPPTQTSPMQLTTHESLGRCCNGGPSSSSLSHTAANSQLHPDCLTAPVNHIRTIAEFDSGGEAWLSCHSYGEEAHRVSEAPEGARVRIMPAPLLYGDQEKWHREPETGRGPLCYGHSSAGPDVAPTISFGGQGALLGIPGAAKLMTEAAVCAESLFPDSYLGTSEHHIAREEIPFVALMTKGSAYSAWANNQNRKASRNPDMQCEGKTHHREPKGDAAAGGMQVPWPLSPIQLTTQESLGSLGHSTDGQVLSDGKSSNPAIARLPQTSSGTAARAQSAAADVPGGAALQDPLLAIAGAEAGLAHPAEGDGCHVNLQHIVKGATDERQAKGKYGRQNDGLRAFSPWTTDFESRATTNGWSCRTPMPFGFEASPRKPPVNNTSSPGPVRKLDFGECFSDDSISSGSEITTRLHANAEKAKASL
ncbi:unnamed protein product [Ostreobium quekettii]|uniref:CAF1B/HIR1 beta-propeller domain-containing protein n=1 Tax=Ostreobium quekettii TaxID=121088 RepID=A0A8S1J8Y6_9CHLO|nr:unnamed protein product [Ostreobium quekettii]